MLRRVRPSFITLKPSSQAITEATSSVVANTESGTAGQQHYLKLPDIPLHDVMVVK